MYAKKPQVFKILVLNAQNRILATYQLLIYMLNLEHHLMNAVGF